MGRMRNAQEMLAKIHEQRGDIVVRLVESHSCKRNTPSRVLFADDLWC